MIDNIKDSNVMIRSLILTSKYITEKRQIKNFKISKSSDWTTLTQDSLEPLEHDTIFFKLPILKSIAINEKGCKETKFDKINKPESWFQNDILFLLVDNLGYLLYIMINAILDQGVHNDSNEFQFFTFFGFF